jgi:hypothetical protein
VLDRDDTAPTRPQAATAGFPREVVLVNVADERENTRDTLGFPPIPGMYMDVPWSDTIHYVDYIQLERSTGTLLLGLLPMEPW